MKPLRILPCIASAFLTACTLGLEGSSSCIEEWHSPGQEKATPQICRPHSTKALTKGPVGFANVDGKACFVVELLQTHTGCVGGGATGPIGLFDLQCWLPKSLRSQSSEKSVFYYQLSEFGSTLRLASMDVQAGAPQADTFDNNFATDGQSVFYREQRVEGADPDSFRVFLPPNAASGDWAFDKNHTYYKQYPVPNLRHEDVTVIDLTFVVSGAHVFSFQDDDERLVERPEIKPPLQVIARGLVRAGDRIYDKGQPSKVALPTSELLSPSCPVPNHPSLPCQQQPGGHLDFVPELIRTGDKIMLRAHDYTPFETLPKADAKRFAYWWHGNDIFAIQNNTLFTLTFGELSKLHTFNFVGRQLMGFGDRFVADEIGFINLYELERESPLCGEVNALARPDKEGQSLFGALSAIAKESLPAGFSAGLENQRYKYLSNEQIANEQLLVIDKKTGRRMNGLWCGEGIRDK